MTGIVRRLHLVIQFKIVVGLLLARKRLCQWMDQFLASPARRGRVMVNIGGGIFLRPRWKVLDYCSPFYPLSRRYVDFDVDLFEQPKFPFADNSVDLFYSSHTLEHIPQEHCPHILAEIHRCLRPGGAVRLTMPDYDKLRADATTGGARYLARKIGQGLTPAEAVVEQIATERVGQVPTAEIDHDFETLEPAAFAERYAAAASREVQRDKGGYHINWFNEAKLTAMLRDAGFSDIYRSAPQGSRFADLRGAGGMLALGNVFDTQRRLGIDTSHPEYSLFVEAVK
jgi:SAM-dependent methyltransferase